MQIQIKKKKRKDAEKILLIDYGCLDQNEIIQTLAEIRRRLIAIFRSHVGQENSISPSQLFHEVFGINPQLVDIYKREYWWNILKKVLSDMRRTGELFVVNKSKFLFVLQTKDELEEVLAKYDHNIKALKEMKDKAKQWVSRQRYADF